MNYITLFSKHPHSLCKLGSLHTTLKLVHPSGLHSVLAGAAVGLTPTQRSNANFQHLRIWALVADICETTFQKKSRCEISDYNTDSEVKLGRVKRHIFDSLGWMPMAELYEGEQIFKQNGAHLQGWP